jgi:hypothetical protein
MPRKKPSTGWQALGTVTLVAVLYGAPPLFSDWLVTVDGGRVETQGPWRVEGEKVFFTLKNGTLSILRKREVDLDASAVATAEANKKPAPVEKSGPEPMASKKPKPTPVLVLTDADIPKAVEPNSAEATATGEAAAKKPSKVVVDSWKIVEKGNALEIVGILRNDSDALESQIDLEVKLKDTSGKEHSAKAFLRQNSLIGGRSTSFRAKMAEIFTVDGEPSFTVTSQAVSVGVTQKETGAEAESSPAADPQPPLDESGEG